MKSAPVRSSERLKARVARVDACDVAATSLAATYLDKVVRFRWALISCWLCLVAVLAGIGSGEGDWDFFRRGAGALVGSSVFGTPGGIHLYASQPDIQIGPPALLVALPFRLLPRPWDLDAARVLMTVGALLALWMVDRLSRVMGVADAPRQRGLLLGGLMLAPAWVTLAVTYAHLDDVLVLLLGVLAVLLVAAEHPLWAATAVGLAVACKPWGIVVTPVLMSSAWRPAMRSVALAAGVAAAWWVPFLSDPRTISGLWNFRVPVSPASGLAALGLDPGPMPGWVRPTQLAVGLLLGVVAARRGHWSGVLLIGYATRVALDPNSFTYYDIAPVLGALVWDLSRTRTGIPWTAGWATAAFAVTSTWGDPSTVGALRLAICTGLVLAVLLRRAPRPHSQGGRLRFPGRIARATHRRARRTRSERMQDVTAGCGVATMACSGTRTSLVAHL